MSVNIGHKVRAALAAYIPQTSAMGNECQNRPRDQTAQADHSCRSIVVARTARSELDTDPGRIDR